MKFALAAVMALFALASCANEPKKPQGPQSESSSISWTGQVTSPIQGQLGMLPQNQHRR